MHLDVHDLRNFYYRSRVGRAAQLVIREDLRRAWPKTTGLTVAGFGFAVPLLRPFLADARRVMALMPGPQGCVAWPTTGPNVTVLCEDTLWPVQTGTVDRLVMLHGLETSDHPAAVLGEAWRVLSPEGRLIVVVPNRSGLWSRTDKTPFGFGRPYSKSQLESQLRNHGFVVESARASLFQPPTAKRGWRRIAAAMERIGQYVPVYRAGGVILAEASKQVPAPTRPGLPAAVTRPLRILEGIGQPVPEPTRHAEADNPG